MISISKWLMRRVSKITLLITVDKPARKIKKVKSIVIRVVTRRVTGGENILKSPFPTNFQIIFFRWKLHV